MASRVAGPAAHEARWRIGYLDPAVLQYPTSVLRRTCAYVAGLRLVPRALGGAARLRCSGRLGLEGPIAIVLASQLSGGILKQKLALCCARSTRPQLCCRV